jgi:hypothetical protein
MFFTVKVDMADNGHFEFATKSLFKLAEIAQMLGNLDVVDEDEDFCDDDLIEVPDELDHLFDDDEEYMYDDDAECFCWYDEEHDAWYWLDEDTGEWLLVEDEDGFEVESEKE